ncbi:recombinase family protein [candidate division WOR-3 bacterium]|nr:recombinase family protein [candidate division WOR-3 bacterium]
MSEEKIKRIGIWIRVSTDMQAQKESPEVHEERAKSYAKAKGWIVKETYKLVTSGKSVMKHPETKRMLNDIKEGEIQGIIFSNLSRIARNTKELIEIAEIFHKTNADLISLTENIDTSTPAGNLLFTLSAALSQWEREEISSRVKASVKTRAKMGKSLGGQAPFGYEWLNKEQLVINKDEAPIVKEIYNTFLCKKRLRTTARIINKEGYRTKKGKTWTATSIHRLLSSRTYKGEHILNHTKSRGEGKGWDEKPQDEWEVCNVEAIISKKQWEKTNKIIKKINEKYKICSRPARRYLLSGLVTCETCGSKMYGKTFRPSNSVYLCNSCRRKIKLEILDNFFIDSLNHYRFNPNDLVLPIQSDESVDEMGQRIRFLNRERISVEDKIDNLLEARRLDVINDDTFSNRISKLEEKREQLKRELARTEGKLAFLKVRKTSENYVENRVRTFTSMFPYMTFEEKRDVVKEVVDRIVINDKEIRISLYYLPFFQKEISSLEKESQTNKGSWRQRA